MRKNYALILFILASFVCVPPSGAQTVLSTNNVIFNFGAIVPSGATANSISIKTVQPLIVNGRSYSISPAPLSIANDAAQFTNNYAIYSNLLCGMVCSVSVGYSYGVVTTNFTISPPFVYDANSNVIGFDYVGPYIPGIGQFYSSTVVTNYNAGGSGGIGAVNTNNFSTNGAVLDFSPTVQNQITNAAQQGAGSTVTFGLVNAGGVFQNASNYNAGYGGAGSSWNGFSTSGTNILDPNGVNLRSAGGGGNSSFATNATYAVQATNLAGIAPGSIVTNSVNLNAVSTGNQTNLFITNCPIAGLNGLYVLQTANPTATSYSWWKQSGGTNYVTQNDPNYYSGGTPYYYSVGPNTNDSAGAVFYQNIALAVFQSNWQTNIGSVSSPPSGKMIAYFLQPALTNSAVMYPPESVTNQWYVDFSELGNDLNDGRTKFTPFRTVGRAVTMSSSNSIINLSSGWSTNDIPNVVLNLNPGTTLIGQGYSTTLTNLIINMADNCSLQKFRASTSLGIQFANVDSANKYILIDSIDFTAPTDGLYTGSIYGRMDVINSRFHSINDTVNFAVYGLLNVSYCTFECLNIPNASGVPQRTFHLIGGSGLAALNFCTFTISNSVSGGFGVGATNECVGTAGPTIQLNNCSLNNWQATNSLAINPTASGTIHGNYVLNGTNQVSIDGFTGSINASNLTGTVQAAQLNGATNALGTTMGTVTTNTISSGTNSVVVSSTNVVINIPATGNFSINVGGVSVFSVSNGAPYWSGTNNAVQNWVSPNTTFGVTNMTANSNGLFEAKSINSGGIAAPSFVGNGINAPTSNGGGYCINGNRIIQEFVPGIYFYNFSPNPAWYFLNDSGTPNVWFTITTNGVYAPKVIQAANGFISTATNYVPAATSFAGVTNNNSYGEFVNVYGTSGNIIFYWRTGASGASAFTPIWTNTVLSSGENIPLGTNCAIQITSGVGVVGTVYEGH